LEGDDMRMGKNVIGGLSLGDLMIILGLFLLFARLMQWI